MHKTSSLEQNEAEEEEEEEEICLVCLVWSGLLLRFVSCHVLGDYWIAGAK